MHNYSEIIFDIDVVSMNMTVKNTTHLREKRNTLKSYVQA